MFVQNIAEYLESLEVERGLSENTIEAYGRDLNAFCEFLGTQGVFDFDSVKRIHINYYIKKLHDENYTAASVTRKIAAIRGWFKWLLANEVIKQDPGQSVELPKLSKRLPNNQLINIIPVSLHLKDIQVITASENIFECKIYFCLIMLKLSELFFGFLEAFLDFSKLQQPFFQLFFFHI